MKLKTKYLWIEMFGSNGTEKALENRCHGFGLERNFQRTILKTDNVKYDEKIIIELYFL